MENLELYDKLKSVPQDAQKKITGGRLNGMTSIQPIWRIKKLTEELGPCGVGWKTEIVKKEIIEGSDGQKAAIVDINFYYKHEDKWSDAIPGTGGSMFVTQEKAGPHVSDECFKMAYTDALSVAAKAIGLAAEIYGDSDSANKYGKTKLNLDEHDIYAIKKRLEEKLTSKIQKLKTADDVAEQVGITTKQIAKVILYCKDIAVLESRLDKI